MTDDWFSFREIAFQDRDCILWIAENIATLEEGRWPQPPIGRRMTDGPVNLLPEPKVKAKNRYYEPIRGREATFCKPEAIAAEFRRRLELVAGNPRADSDRILFEEHVLNGVETYRLARIKACPVWQCDYRIKRELKFLTGKGLHYIDGHVANSAEWMAKRGREIAR